MQGTVYRNFSIFQSSKSKKMIVDINPDVFVRHLLGVSCKLTRVYCHVLLLNIKIYLQLGFFIVICLLLKLLTQTQKNVSESRIVNISKFLFSFSGYFRVYN